MLNAPRLNRNDRLNAKAIILTGGLNEQLSNLELSGGELTDVQNYVEKDGSVNGYTSFEGYERYDGQTSPTNVSVTVDPDTGEVTDDTAREAARTAILPIPGSGITRGVHIYENEVYGWRDNAGATTIEMYKATSSGWSKITSGTGSAGGTIRAISDRFSLYNTNDPVMIWVDGVSEIHIYNGSTITTVGATGSGADIEEASLPAGVYPEFIGTWNNRLFIAYTKGHIFFSAVGDPTDFAAGSGAGELYIGDDVTGFTVTPGGAFLITMKDRIDFLTDLTDTADGVFAFARETFSPHSGAITGTVKRMLGTVYFADDRGVTTLEAAQEFGDFLANSLAKKVERTYQNNKKNISLAITNRSANQYILIFNGPQYAEGLVFSFKGKRLKGATKIKLSHRIYNVAEGKNTNREDEIYVGSDDGYVFKMFTGTSFDGETIDTRLATSFYHYGSPTRWKHFKEVMFEVTGDSYTDLTYRADFDYNESYMPTSVTETDSISSSGGVWGVGVWGTFTWGGGNVDRIKDKIAGYGSNMRLLLVSSSKYKNPHSLHNMVVQYTLGSTKV